MKLKTIGALAIAGIIGFGGIAQADLNDGLVAYYPFNGDASDASENGNNGVTYGGITYQAGVFGQAASFDGVDSYIETTDENSFDFGTNSFTLSAWVYRASDGQHAIVSKERSGLATSRYSLKVYQSGVTTEDINKITFTHYNDSNNCGTAWDSVNGASVKTPNEIPNQEWMLISAVREGLNYKLYIDGVKVDEYNSGCLADVQNDLNFRIGARYLEGSGTAPKDFFHGLIDELRIYNRALAESEIQELYTATDSGSTEQPVATLPEPPVMSYLTSGTYLNINWTGASGADGYKLYYAPYPSGNPIQYIDMGNQASLSTQLPIGAAYYMAVTAYNDAGESGYSNIDHFTISESDNPVSLTEVPASGMGDFVLYEVTSTDGLLDYGQVLAAIAIRRGLDILSAALSPTSEALAVRAIQDEGIIPTFNLLCSETSSGDILPMIWLTPAALSFMNDLGIIELAVSAVPTVDYYVETGATVLLGSLVPGWSALRAITDANPAPLSLSTTRTSGYPFLESDKRYLLLPRDTHQFSVRDVVVQDSSLNRYATIIKLRLEGLRDLATINDSCVVYGGEDTTITIAH